MLGTKTKELKRKIIKKNKTRDVQSETKTERNQGGSKEKKLIKEE
jgi:hypothetical protein